MMWDDHDNPSEGEIWNQIVDSLLKMSQEEFDTSVQELRDLVSHAICDKMDEMESELLTSSASLSESSSVINRIQSRSKL